MPDLWAGTSVSEADNEMSAYTDRVLNGYYWPECPPYIRPGSPLDPTRDRKPRETEKPQEAEPPRAKRRKKKRDRSKALKRVKALLAAREELLDNPPSQLNDTELAAVNRELLIWLPAIVQELEESYGGVSAQTHVRW